MSANSADPQRLPSPSNPASNENERISTKLSTRITNLSSTASKESIQTLTKWILFHMDHHTQVLTQTLSQHIIHLSRARDHDQADAGADANAYHPTPSSHLLVAWSITHELCTSHSTISPGGGHEQKWTSLAPFREALLETVIRPGLESLRVFFREAFEREHQNQQQLQLQLEMLMKARDHIKALVPVWQDLNCFDSPTLMVEIKRLFAKVVQEDGTNLDGADDTDLVADHALAVPSSTTDGVPDQMIMEDRDETMQEDEDHVVDFDTSNDAEEEEREVSTHDTGTGAGSNTIVDNGINTPIVVEDHEQKKDEDEDMKDANYSDDETPPVSAPMSETVLEPVPIHATTNAPDNDIDASANANGQNSNKAKKNAPKEEEFDFENQGIAEEKVAVRELVPPCKSIATIQITRDLRNDSSHNLSTVMASVPQAVLDACRKAKESGDVVDLKELPVIPDDVLDLDVIGALANAKLHREVIKKQKELRRKCIELLIKSRCKFGSAEAAEIFYSFDDITDKLKKRKALILDAMELEGLDFEAMDGNGVNAGGDDKLSDFTWLTREDTANKKLRTE